MVQSAAKTVAGYLKELPAERRAEVTKVLGVLRRHMPKGFEEDIGYGMIGWTVCYRSTRRIASARAEPPSPPR